MAVIEGDRAGAEMLHMFFRLMELECSLLPCEQDPIPTLRRVSPDVLILDLDLPERRARRIAGDVRTCLPHLPIIYLSDFDAPEDIAPVVPKPHGRFEEMLGVLEAVLEVGCR